MAVYEIDPQKDSRWTELVAKDPRSSIFHTREWLEALRQTYGYKATAFTTSEPRNPLVNGVVFCEVNSWLTGSRLVSIPFSDHCEPLVRDMRDLCELLCEIQKKTRPRLEYAEIRPRLAELPSECDSLCYWQGYLHVIDLQPDEQELYARLHKNSIQRKIRRAERELLTLERGNSEALLKDFYHLLLLTRRRHHLLPQPFAWFRNLAKCCGENLTIRLARANGQPIASILTLQHKRTLIYKYGCSDARFHKTGAMPSLFWQAIREGHSNGLLEFDLGRSEETDSGLVRFKDRLGAQKVSLNIADDIALALRRELLRPYIISLVKNCFPTYLILY